MSLQPGLPKKTESGRMISHRGLLLSLFALTVFLAMIPLLRGVVYENFFSSHANRPLLADLGLVAEVVLMLVWGFTLSMYIVEGLKRREREARAYEEKILQLRHTFEDLVKHHPHGILICDRDGNLLQANTAASQLLGQTFAPDYNIGRDPFWQSDEPAGRLKEARSGKIVILAPWRRATADGAEMVLRTTLFPLFDDKRNVSHLVALHEDVSEQQNLEEQLLHAQKMESVGALAGGIAHDFNNILQAVLGNASMIKHRLQDPSTLGRYADAIEQSARRGANLTGQLLSFARGAPPQMRPINLNHCVENVLKLLGGSLEKTIQIESRLHPDLWSVQGDPAQIEQALMNLCLNSRDAMPKGGRLIIVTDNIDERATVADRTIVRHLARRSSGRLVTLTVQDTGIGMNEATRLRVFEPFFTTKALDKGTGLGAAIVYSIVQKHGAYIEVTSMVGRGTTFHIYFPASSAVAVPLQAATEQKTAAGAERILIVDDEEEILTSLQEGLKELGYRVTTARNGDDALLLMQREGERIDVIVLDMIMPRRDGLSTLLEIMKLRPDARVILSSAYSETAPIQAAMKAGAKRLLQKPYAARELAVAIREVLEARPLDKAVTAA